MPTTRSSQISQPALSSSEEDFDISNFVDGIAENDKLLGIKPAAAGALDITASYNEGSKRIVESFLNFIRRDEKYKDLLRQALLILTSKLLIHTRSPLLRIRKGNPPLPIRTRKRNPQFQIFKKPNHDVNLHRVRAWWTEQGSLLRLLQLCKDNFFRRKRLCPTDKLKFDAW